MNWLRDPELREYGWLYLLATGVSATGGWIVAGWVGLTWALVCSGFFILLILSQTRRRYQQLRRFSQEIDRVLHGATQVPWEEYAEGELAILQNEVRKLTLMTEINFTFATAVISDIPKIWKCFQMWQKNLR